MNTTRNNTTIAVTLLLLLCGCKGEHTEQATTQYVKTTTVSATNQGGTVSYPGKTRSKDDANLSFRVSGPISKVMVKEGEHVRKGQTIALMDPRDYQVQLSATQAEYEQVKADAERIIAMYEEGNTTASKNSPTTATSWPTPASMLRWTDTYRTYCTKQARP